MTELEIKKFIIWYRSKENIIQRALDPTNVAKTYIETQKQPTDIVVESIDAVCECQTPYFPTDNIHWCSKCNRPTVY